MQVIVMGLFKLVTNTALLCCKTGAKLIHERKHETISFVFLPQAWSFNTSTTFKYFAILPIVCLQYGRPYPSVSKRCLKDSGRDGRGFVFSNDDNFSCCSQLTNWCRLARNCWMDERGWQELKNAAKNMVSIICLAGVGLRLDLPQALPSSNHFGITLGNKC